MANIPIIPKFIKGLIYFFYNCVIPPECEIGEGVRFWHSGLGVVIHRNVVIGSSCNIYNHVVFGGGHESSNDNTPIEILIGESCNIFSGAKILCKQGRLVIGRNSTVGANAVVISDVPANTVVGGIPARVIKNKES